MSLRSWWLRQRLQRIERKLKVAHARQRKARKQVEKAEALRRKGKLTAQAYEARVAKLEAQKTRFTNLVSELMGEHKRVEQDLRAQDVAQ